MVIGKENNDFFYTSSAITVVVSISDIAKKLYRDSKEEVLLLLKGTQVGYYWLPIRYKDVTYPIFDNYIEFRQWFEDNLYEVPAGVYIGDDAPTLPSPYPFWLDTSTSPEVLFININNEFWLEYAGGTSQIQSDWGQEDDLQLDYIKNKPTIPTNSDFTLEGLGEKSYNSLTDNPDLSPLHTQNSDTILDEDGTNEVSAQEIREHIDDADIHFEINDSTVSTSSVYSSDKVDDLLSAKEDSLGFTPTQKLTASITIAVADWSGGTTCTKTVAGLLTTDTVIPAMDRDNFDLYSTAYITGDSTSTAGQITFTCGTTPTAEIVIPIEIIR